MKIIVTASDEINGIVFSESEEIPYTGKKICLWDIRYSTEVAATKLRETIRRNQAIIDQETKDRP